MRNRLRLVKRFRLWKYARRLLMPLRNAPASLLQRFTLVLFAWTLVWSVSLRADAQQRPTPDRIWFAPAPQVSVLTFGPGDQAFLKFGHNAIRVTYPNKGPDLVYNFGTFRFDNPLLILDFLTGKFEYWLSVTSFEANLEHYRAANRDVIEQQLNLGNPGSWDLAEALALNARPENRVYLYDYYRDNCSTRVRDAIDTAYKGGFKERATGPGSMSLRDHTLRLVADDFWLYLGLDIAMGSFIDQPETRWSEMFLPEKVESGLASVVFVGAHGSQPVVKKRIVHHEAVGRPQLRTRPPNRTFGFLQAGLVIGGTWLFLAWEAYRRRQRWAQAALALTLGAFGLVTGILGLLFLGLWLLTNHQVAFHNENLLQCGPWGLGLAACAWGLWRNQPRAIQWSYRIAIVGLGASILGLLGKLLPFMQQDNQRIIALVLPLWCGAVAALALLRLRIVRPLLVPINAEVLPADPFAAEEDTSERPRDSKRPSKRPPKPEQDDADDERAAPSPSQRPAPAE